MGYRLIGQHIPCAFSPPRSIDSQSIGSFLGWRLCLLIALPVIRTFSPPKVREMSSTRKDYKVDDQVKRRPSSSLACDKNHVTRLLITTAMRAKGYSDTKAVDQALQMHVHQEVKKLKGGVSAAAPAALSAVAAMVVLSSMVTTRAHALIPPEDASSTLPLGLIGTLTDGYVRTSTLP